jgi:hypothetical protein
MRRISIVAIAWVVIASAAEAAAAPPAALYGKSVIISWSEMRQQRNVGEAAFRSVAANHSMSIYVSSAGHVFSRFAAQTRRGSGSSEQVAGEGGHPEARVPSFGGRSMTLFVPFRSGGIRRIIVDFDAAFVACSTRVAYARELGQATSIGYSTITKNFVEFQTIEVGAPSCSVQSANVFGGQ